MNKTEKAMVSLILDDLKRGVSMLERLEGVEGQQQRVVGPDAKREGRQPDDDDLRQSAPVGPVEGMRWVDACIRPSSEVWVLGALHDGTIALVKWSETWDRWRHYGNGQSAVVEYWTNLPPHPRKASGASGRANDQADRS